MALNLNIANLAALTQSWAQTTFTGKVQQAADELDISGEQRAMLELKTMGWDMARSAAAARGDDKPSLTDYIIATQSEQMQGAVAQAQQANPNLQWNYASMVNFSDMTLKNVRIEAADLHANNLTLEQREELGISDEEIGLLYAAVGNNTVCFHFEGVHFHPADTINHYLRDANAVVKNCTFDGMGQEDTLELKSGSYSGITFTNIEGGVIALADGAQVTDMNMRGAKAELRMGRASISGLNAEGAHIVELHAAPDAVIDNANFTGATIAMSSQLRGVVLQGVNFTDANLDGVDLRGAELRNVTIDGRPATAELLQENGVTIDATTRISGPARTAQAAIEAGPREYDPAAENAAILSMARPAERAHDTGMAL